ncbi:hypothetical protein XELAEV_18006800mg [Xenopus laevis]|uniref:Uncharacterized protein n=1 Tax=Xenopus laevis TaxID=8355 RepID=A0A974E0C1_XENLA|nr:hypothetical protein XELAEV_18006800mg [Xenopus laevis]
MSPLSNHHHFECNVGLICKYQFNKILITCAPYAYLRKQEHLLYINTSDINIKCIFLIDILFSVTMK